MSLATRATSTAAGLALSRVVPTLPDRLHPVAWFGSTMSRVEAAVWRDDRAAGVGFAAVGVALGALAGRAVRSTTAVVTICAAGPQLRRVAGGIADALERGDVEHARSLLPMLVGRDPRALDASGIAAAAIESVAENMVDAVFAPACWGLSGGAAGVAAHRAINTMDAMVGRRNARYENFGWAAARTDDVANWVPARAFAVTVAAVCPGRGSAVVATVRADASAHPSPNAGVAEAAMAGALGRELGGPLRYGDVTEDRPRLGTGPRPDVADLRTAITLAERAETMLVVMLAAIGLMVHLGRRSR